MILDTMSRGTTKWAKVVDLSRMRVTFRTDVSPKLRHVDLDSFDFSCQSPRLLLDIHADLSGDVRSSFEEYTEKAHRAQVEKTIGNLAEFPELRQPSRAWGALGKV